MTWATHSRRRSELPANWETLRRAVFTRDNYQCVLCGQPATDCDHIGDRHDHTLANLRALCHTCHKQRTSRQGGSAPRHLKLRKNNPERHPAYQ